MQDTRTAKPTRCCESGQPIAIDPATGSTICSCQMQSGVPAYLSRVPRLPESFYGSMLAGHGGTTEAAAAAAAAMYPTYPADRRIPDARPAAPGLAPSYHLPPHAMPAHPYNPYYPEYDVMGVRRKNATRETTGPLKSWLYQHRKNPYPTKAEKVMLAIITQMTLTQVSTWFANARRRLKKENRLGKDVDISDIDVDGDKSDSESSKLNMSLDSSISESSDLIKRSRLSSDVSDISDAEDRGTPNAVPKKCVQRLFSPDSRDELYLDRMSSPETEKAPEINRTLTHIAAKTHDGYKLSLDTKQSNPTRASENIPTKPKIWSITDMLR